MSASPVEPGTFLRAPFQAESRAVPTVFLKTQAAARRFSDDLFTSSEMGEPEQKRARREFTVPAVEVKVPAPEGGYHCFSIPRNTLCLLSPRFREIASESIHLEGPEDPNRSFIHYAAVEYILHFARLKSGYIGEKDFQPLASLKWMHPDAFGEIFCDIVRLCKHFEIQDLTQRCAGFLGEELSLNPTEHLQFYLRWALRFDQRDFFKSALSFLYKNKALRLKLYPALASLILLDPSPAWAKLLQQSFDELLPQDAEGEEIIQISSCYVTLFPQCEAPRGVHAKIGAYHMGAIRDQATLPGKVLEDHALAFYVVGLSKGFLGSYQQLFLSEFPRKDKKINELHMLMVAVFSKSEERIEKLHFFHTGCPGNIFAMQMLCHLYFAAKNTQACIEWAEKILRLKADYTPAILSRAEGHFAQGNLEAAAQDAKLAYEIDPADATVHFARAKYQYLLSDYDSAIRLCTGLIQKDNKDVQSWYLRGRCFLSKGQLDPALSDMKQALLLHPKHVDILTDIGMIYLSKNLLDASLEYLNAAAGQPDHHFWTLRTRGECLLKGGSFPEAIADFTRALKLAKEPAPMTYALRAQCHMLIGNLQGCKNDIAMALTFDPKCELALQLKDHMIGR